MTTVTIRETPSEAIINKGTAIETIAAGARTISLRKPTVLGQYRG